MEVSDEEVIQCARRIILSRMRLLCEHGFYGLLLMHMKFSISDIYETVWSDGKEYIFFHPEFLETRSDTELDQIMLDLISDLVQKQLEQERDADAKESDQTVQCGNNVGIAQNSFEIEEEVTESETEIWKIRIMQAAEVMCQRDKSRDYGDISVLAERVLLDLRKHQIDWRIILAEFIQEEINDYSFCPPDRRFSDSLFFLPDFNEKEYGIKKILFMIDTSGSMSDEDITKYYSEIKGALDQMNGRIEGWLGFFDTAIIDPKPFADKEELTEIRPQGAGGTRFDIIFNYVKEKMQDELPVSIVILTDGYAPFPPKDAAMGIPVLWVVNNEEVMPPWGKVARMVN